jgi:plastocyanin
MMRVVRPAAVLTAAFFLGCGTGTEAPKPPPGEPEVVAARAADGAHVVRMTMRAGGRFEPDLITVSSGEVVRFVNVSNVHNVAFPRHLNPEAGVLPAASPYLVSPGQTWELRVDLEPGTYHFQCDPHAADGMIGTLVVIG